MNWKIRKSTLVMAAASAIALVAVACGSDTDSAPADSGAVSPSPTATPAPAASIGIPPPAAAISDEEPEATPVPEGSNDGQPAGVFDYLALARALEAAGVDMAESDQLFPPIFFAVSGRDIRVGGEQDSAVPAIVFQFEDEAARIAAQAMIDLDAGTIGEASLDDFDRLAFFGSGVVIVMYIGDNADTIDLLSFILGEPIERVSGRAAADPTATARKLVDAPIQSVELLIMESDPVQVTANIAALLPNGCHLRRGVIRHTTGNIFGINVVNTVPALDGLVCTDNIESYSESVRLGVDGGDAVTRFPFKNGVTYTLVVNDHVLEFTTNGVTDDAATLSGYDALNLAIARRGVFPIVTSETVTGVFGIEARFIQINGNDIQVHEFETADIAASTASGVSEDGGTLQQLDGSISSVNWIGPPHFFLLDNVIALYIGDDETVITALLGISGESFAGSPIELVQNGPTQAPTPDTGALAPFPIPTQPAPIESVELT